MAAAEQVLANVRAGLSDDCLVLLEEVIKRNITVVEENKRQRGARKATLKCLKE